MPTGYTAAIIEKDGISFEKFAMNCARAFGALVTMRDEPNDAEIPEEFKPSPYYTNAIAEAQKRIEELRAMTPEQQVEYGERKKAEGIQSAEKYAAGYRRNGERLNAMREKVLAWEAPSSDHQQMKVFMLEQIDSTIKYDGTDDHSQRDIQRLTAKDPVSFYTDALANAMRDIGHYATHAQEESKRAEERTRWVRQLRESLKPRS